jgi:DNA mismatch repair protein MutH
MSLFCIAALILTWPCSKASRLLAGGRRFDGNRTFLQRLKTHPVRAQSIPLTTTFVCATQNCSAFGRICTYDAAIVQRDKGS